MKLETIDLVDYGSHRATHWDPGDARLCVLVGPMGAGKTTLIEGIRHALYKDDRSSIDGVVRTGATESAVTIEYSFAGARYRAIRRRSIRAGGKSSADLQIQRPDGSWAPVASGSDEVPVAVRALLHMDEATFRSSVFLAQGDLKRFVEATPGKGSAAQPGRAALLSSIVVDPRFALAEVEARGRATKLEATIASERAQAERLETAIAELGDVEQDRARALEAVAGATTEITAAQERRTAIDARLVGLAGDLAASAAAEADVARLDRERASLADRYRREQKTITDAAAAADAARARLASADEVEQAIAELPAALATLAELEALEAEDHRIAGELQDAAAEVDVLERPYERDHAAWSVRWKDAKKKVGELEEHGRSGTSVCEACGQAIGKDTALEQLAAARATVYDLNAAEPKRPLAIDRHRATIARLEAKRPKVDFTVTAAARHRVTRLTAAAARGEAITTARAALETAKAAAADATAELARITAAGESLAVQLAAAREKVAGAQALYDERDALGVDARGLSSRQEAAEQLRRVAEHAVARAEASLERLTQLQAERSAIVKNLSDAEEHVGRLRRMVGAFGVKGIPARIVERVLPELGRYANDMLGQLVPGASIEIRAQRAKGDGKGVIESIDLVYRDAEGERAMDRPSGGETTAVSLALAIGLNRLNARRSGSAIRLLVVDEPDGLDVPGRRAFGQALRGLAHSGELDRVVLITHTPDLVDYADAVWQFSKNGAGTHMDQVA